jgi:hypothetical protein
MHSHSILVFEILKHKFLYFLEQYAPSFIESIYLLLRGNKELAKWVLKDEIKVLFNYSENDIDKAAVNLVSVYNELASLLTFDDFRYLLTNLSFLFGSQSVGNIPT